MAKKRSWTEKCPPRRLGEEACLSCASMAAPFVSAVPSTVFISRGQSVPPVLYVAQCSAWSVAPVSIYLL